MALDNVKIYFDQWLKTATDGRVVSHWALVTNRLQLKCNICEAMLTTKQPTGPSDVDYSVQQFVNLHSHKGNYCDHMVNGKTAWVEVPKTGSSQCQKCLMWMHGDSPPPKPTAVTLDFKKVNVSDANNIDLNNNPVTNALYPTYTTNSTNNPNNTPAPFGPKYTGKIDENYQNQLIIQQQMEKYAKEVEAESLELELKAKKIQLEAAQQVLTHFKKGTDDLLGDGLITAAQQEALLEQQEKLNAEIIEQQKAKEQALQNILKIKMLQEQLQEGQMEFHTTKVTIVKKPKPLKIATGRKFR